MSKFTSIHRFVAASFLVALAVAAIAIPSSAAFAIPPTPKSVADSGSGAAPEIARTTLEGRVPIIRYYGEWSELW